MIATMRRHENGDGWLGRKARADGRWPASYIGSEGRRVYIYGRDNHINPALGARPLRRLMSQEIARLYSDLRPRLAPASIAQLHAVLHSALGQAVQWRILPANPADAVRAPRPVRREMLFLDADQVRTLPWHVTERAFKPLLRRAELPELRFHDLRHTFASMMLSEGIRIEVVSKMLGHAPAIKLNIYAHLMPGDEEAAVMRLQARIGGGA
jgi:integrase